MSAQLKEQAAPRHCKFAIVGTGFSGLGMAIRLKQEGEQDFLLFEREGGVSGTWRVNHYPGLACDVQSHLYSFSFEPNPNWTRMFAPQQEIQRYLESCWSKYGLVNKTLLNTAIVQVRWDDEQHIWRLKDANGNEYTAKYVVSGMGALSTALIPNIKGLDKFKGKMFHSQQWDHDYDLKGKRVAIIGTGASAIQFVPEVQKQAAHVDLYQRTPPWIMPKPDRQISEGEQSRFNKFGFLQKLWRGALYMILEGRVLGMVITPKIMTIAEKISLRNMEKHVRDPELRAKLTPDYAMGCKRVLLSNNYYQALAQPNVDVITDAVAEVKANSVVTADGKEREVDTILFGTGFKPTDPFPRGVVIGRDGVDILDKWTEGPEAYKGTMVSGFPNLFFLMGPNTGLGHSSMVYMIETQINYILKGVRLAEESHLDTLEPRPEAQQAYNEKLQKKLRATVWSAGGCSSWYLHPVSGRNCTLWPGFTWQFRLALRNFDPQAYHFDRFENNPLRTLQAQAAQAAEQKAEQKKADKGAASPA